MSAKPNLYLLHRPADVSPETIAELEDLLADARAGNVTGLIVSALYSGAAMTVNVTGRCRTIPVISLGMAHMLLQEIEKLT